MKKVLAVLLASVLAISLLAGCNTTAQEQDVVYIDFWHAMTGPHQTGIQELIERFHETQDHVRVNEVFQGGYNDLRNQLMANAITLTMPHLAQATVADVSFYILEDMILSLQPFVDDPEIGMSQEEIDDLVTVFREASFWDGEFYNVPFSKSTRVLFYNIDLFEEHDLAVPETWDDILHAAQVLTCPEAGRIGMGFENSIDMEWSAILVQLGGQYMCEETNTVTYATEEGFEALAFIVDLVNSDYGRTAGADGFMSGVFGRQDVAMYIGSSAGLPHVSAAVADTFNWGTAPTPGTGDVRATQFAGNDIVMFSLNNSHTEAERRGAWEFLRFTMDPEQSAIWAAMSGYIPVRYESVELDYWVNHVTENPRDAAGIAQFDYGFFLTRSPQASAIRNALLPELENALLLRATPEEALTRAQERGNNILLGIE